MAAVVACDLVSQGICPHSRYGMMKRWIYAVNFHPESKLILNKVELSFAILFAYYIARYGRMENDHDYIARRL